MWTPLISCLPRVPGLSPSSLSCLPVFLKMETHPCHKLLPHTVQAPWTKLAETRNLNKPLLFKLSCNDDEKDSPDSHTLRGSHSGPRHSSLNDSSGLLYRWRAQVGGSCSNV